jgi:hypothetical protein
MTGQLPAPQSIWFQTATRRFIRVIYSDAHEILAHDAELADRMTVIVSWRGSASDFAEQFQPSDSEFYPKTAS